MATLPNVGEALFWGVLGSSSLLVGGLLALRVRIRTELLGLIMAFGAVVLISAVAFELVQEAFETSAGSGGVALGLALGSLAFFAGGAILTMLADTMMPEAFEHGGRYVGLATTAGFGLAFAITALE